MATKQEMQHCRTSNKVTLHIGKKPSHLLHLILSILTSGIWLIIWLFIALSSWDPMRCTDCGNAS